MDKQKQKTKKQLHLESLVHATRAARNTFFIVIALTIIKAFGGYVTNIIPLIGDAIGSFGDIIAASGIYIGLTLSQKKASKTFTYGYHRIETFISLIIGLFVVYGGYMILNESITRFSVQAKTSLHSVGIITAVISIAMSLYIFRYQLKIAKNINSTAFLASAYDKRNDALVSLGVLFSVLADQFKIPHVEGTIGIALAILIIITGLKHAKNAIFYLLDYWNEPEITKEIKSILEKSKIVTAVKNIRLRKMGTYIFGEAFLRINPFTDSKDLRDEIHRLENKIEANIEHLGDLVLYIDPPKPTLVHVAIPVMTTEGLKSNIAENPKEKFHFLFVEILNGAIKNHYTTKETFSIDQISKIANFLKQNKTNILISSMIESLLFYNLRLNNIKVYPHFLNVKDAHNTIKLLMLDI